MANRREFLERILIGSGAAAFVAKTRAFTMWFSAATPRLLPEGWEFYEMDGTVIFPVYGQNGGISARYMCWLIQRSGKQWYSIPVEFTWLEVAATDEAEAIERVCVLKIRNAIEKVKPVPVNLDGGVLPMPHAA